MNRFRKHSVCKRKPPLVIQIVATLTIYMFSFSNGHTAMKIQQMVHTTRLISRVGMGGRGQQNPVEAQLSYKCANKMPRKVHSSSRMYNFMNYQLQMKLNLQLQAMAKQHPSEVDVRFKLNVLSISLLFMYRCTLIPKTV